MKRGVVIGIILVVALAFVSYYLLMRPPMKKQTIPDMPAVSVMSAAFMSEQDIPGEFTCDGQDVSPPFNITGIPKEAKTIVLIMDDPDSPTGTWDHWVMFNIPAQSESLQSIPSGEEPHGVRGKNSWGKLGYGGPCPGQGSHRYYFKVYALDIVLPLSEGSTKAQVEQEMAGHVVAYGELMGRYESR